ncbi:MBL fold metallo-hydrolase [Halioglobus maricola]|uniref:MBL fold metallo-hydrolase n=1 Tax=Halioglobus maricola TaxID=2601894 RepID=A0A5P9NM78_9GAMM|nr:alkyl sulfatase dimerization domain-containing protein [Halioglobus maricola]QFU76605.1 MBL fold metallo-hydrolase [Halioglobus maricola]
MRIARTIGFLAGVFSAAVVAQVEVIEEPSPYHVERTWPDYFLEHKKLFTEKSGTYRAGEHPVWTVHVPGGWIGNSTIIEGDDGLIVYDTSVNVEAGAHIAKEIRKISDKPIKAIFYSHHHTDHYNGTSALVSKEQVERGEVQIYAWENFEREVAQEFGAILPRQLMGVFYYGPDILPKEEQHYHGCCAPKVLGGAPGYLPPTHTMDQDMQLEIAGVKINVIYTGGEAISEFGLHLPDMNMMIMGDEFFYALANVHSIRGSKPRLPENYISALDKIREIQPDWLLGSHIMPMGDPIEIQRAVTVSRDAIQYIWDQSIRYINKGYNAAELQQKFLTLPPHLDHPPYTRPMYGTPWIIAPEIFHGWVSWFSGDATDLLPTEPVEKARRYVKLMGGRDKVFAEAERAFFAEDYQFAAELTQLLVRIEHLDWDARYLKAAALRARGYGEINTIARAWYLNGANELEGKVNSRMLLGMGQRVVAGSMPPGELLRSWRYQVDADKAGATRLQLGFEFVGASESIPAQTYHLTLRNSILEVDETELPEGLPRVRLTIAQLRSILAGKEVNADIGDSERLSELLTYLDREPANFSLHVR